MYHIPKQSHYVRCPALKLLCRSLYGLRQSDKKVRRPCSTHIRTWPDTLALMTNVPWHVSCYFSMFSGILSINATSCSLVIRWAYEHFRGSSEELCQSNVAQFQQKWCFSGWHNGIGKWRSWFEIKQLVCLRGYFRAQTVGLSCKSSESVPADKQYWFCRFDSIVQRDALNNCSHRKAI